MQLADRHLINECLNGDSSAFGMLVDKYKESIYALAYSKLRNFHDAEDVTQEAFIKAYQNLRKLRRWDDFHAWMYAIANNLCKMLLRTTSTRPDREFIEDHAPLADSYNTSQDSMIEQLHEALDLLPEHHQQVLTLYYLGGMDSKEIAEFLGMSPTAVWQRLSRARLSLRKEMLDMMSETLQEHRIMAGFTFRIMEMIKHVRIQPLSPRTLPWYLSLATGLVIAFTGLGVHFHIDSSIDYASSTSTAGMSRVLRIGELPVDIIDVSDVISISPQELPGDGSGNVAPNPQNSLLMLPQAEGGTWTKKADMPAPRMLLSPTAGVVNGKIYIIGGYDDNDRYISTCEEYDPTTDKWMEKADMPTARGRLSTCAINGKIYAFGGWTDNAGIELSAVEEYDPKVNRWIKKADMPTGRQSFSTNVIGDKIYIIGGWRGGVVLLTVEEYDPVKDKWIKKANMPNAKYDFSSSVVNGKIYVAGGCSLGGIWGNGGAVSTVEEYNPTTDTWTKKADMPTARAGFSTSVVNGKIYAIGGLLFKGKNDDYTTAVEEYDPLTDKWIKKADMPTTRSTFSSGVVNGKIYVIGGNGGAGGTIVEEYDPGTGQSINLKGKLPTTWGDMRTALNE